MQIRALAAAKESENLDFRRHINVHHPPPHLLAQIAAKVTAAIDCTQCSNCCRETLVEVSEGEVGAIARFLNMDVDEVVRQYTLGGRMLRQNSDGCAFLDGNLCMIYAVRPQACREFPHLTLAHTTLGGRISSLERNAWLCPIVYNALEAFKHALGYPKSQHDAS